MDRDRLQHALDRAGYDEDTELLVGYDMNGPITTTDSTGIRFHDGIEDALQRVDDQYETAIISGHPITTLEMMLDQADCEKFYTVGELGAAYDAGDGIQDTTPISDTARQQLYHDIFEQAGREQRKLLVQPNRSGSVASIKYEAEGAPEDPRAEIYDRDDVDTDLTTTDIWEAVQDIDTTAYDGDLVTFENTPEQAGTIADRLTDGFCYPGIRFHHLGDRIGIKRDRDDDPDATVEEGWAFIERATNGGWETDHNDDWGSDLIHTSTDPTKEAGARALLRDGLGEDPDEYVITHIGDKPSDVMTGANTVFVAQEDSPAEQYCQDNGIEHLTAADAAEYTAAIEDVVEERYR